MRPLVSGMEISSSRGLKKTLKLARGKEKAYLPRAYGPWEGKLFFPWANLMVFYNPWDEEISIPEIRKSLIEYQI